MIFSLYIVYKKHEMIKIGKVLRGRVVRAPGEIPLRRVGEQVRFPWMPWLLYVSLLCSKNFLYLSCMMTLIVNSSRIYKRTIMSRMQIWLHVQWITNTKFQNWQSINGKITSISPSLQISLPTVYTVKSNVILTFSYFIRALKLI